MRKQKYSLVELMAVIGVFGIMIGFSAATFNSTLHTNKNLDMVRSREIQVERTADKIRLFVSKFTEPAKIKETDRGPLVSSGDKHIAFVKPNIILYEKNKKIHWELPETMTVQFSKKSGIQDDELLLIELKIIKGDKEKKFVVKVRVGEKNEKE